MYARWWNGSMVVVFCVSDVITDVSDIIKVKLDVVAVVLDVMRYYMGRFRFLARYAMLHLVRCKGHQLCFCGISG